MQLTEYFLFSGPLNSRVVVSTNPRRSISVIIRPASLAPTPHSKSLKPPFFPPSSDACFELQKVVFTTSPCLKATRCCHVIGWLAVLTSQCVLNKVAGECISSVVVFLHYCTNSTTQQLKLLSYISSYHLQNVYAESP